MNPFILVVPYEVPKDKDQPYATVVVENHGNYVMLSARMGAEHSPIALSVDEATTVMMALGDAITAKERRG